MSWQASAWAKEQIKNLSAPYDKLMLMVLAEYAHPESHEAWPTQATLAGILGTSERQVRRAIRSLEVTGLILQVAKGNQYQSSLYRLDVRGFQMSAAQIQAPDMSAPDTMSPALAPDNIDQVHRTKRTSAPDSPVTSNLHEPPLEPTEDTEIPDWLEMLRDIDGWEKRGEPKLPALLKWVAKRGWTEEQLERSAIGLGKVQMKYLEGYSSLCKAFQDRLNNGYDDPQRNGTGPAQLALGGPDRLAIMQAKAKEARQ